MRVWTSGKLWRVVGIVTALCALSGGFASSALAEENEQFENERLAALNVGLQGYVYAQPLLDSQRIYSIRSVTKADTQGDAPVNQFSHLETLSTTKEGCVVAPNADTLYSIAEMKLTPQPIVIHVPSTEPVQLNVIEMLSPYTENFATIGQQASGLLAPGSYVVAGPGKYSSSEEIDGLKVIHSAYDQVWLIARTIVKGPSDVATAHAIQAEEKLVPLKNYRTEGLAYRPPSSEAELATACGQVPGAQPGESRLKYWTALGKDLKKFPPAGRGRAAARKTGGLPHRAGHAPDPGQCRRRRAQRPRRTVIQGPNQVLAVRETITNGFAAHNGWLVGGLGDYGTNDALRAEADRLGVGAPTPNLSIYPLALTDRNGVKLNATTTRYVVRFPAGDFPIPVQAFSSLTMYESSGFFVANPLDRYTLGDRSNLQYNADGSLDVYVQTAEPTSEAEQDNWLPAPPAAFR